MPPLSKSAFQPASISAVFAAASVLAVVLATAQSSPAPSPAPKTASQQFKNIQVLKDIPPDQLMPAMQFMQASLGVECDFCHVQGAFEKDDKKPKQTARAMMKMMFAINQSNFDGHREVTCYTCHRGSNDPSGTPRVVEVGAKPTEAMKGEESNADLSKLPAAAEIIDRYIAALGGAEAIKKLESRVQHGKANFGGHETPIDIYVKAPNMRASVMHTAEGDNVTAFDGTTGWLGMIGGHTREVHGADVEVLKIDSDLRFPLHLKEMWPDLKNANPETIAGHQTYQVIARGEGRPTLRLFFDLQSHLLVRMIRYSESPLGRIPTQLDYADYKGSDGFAKTPTKWSIARPTGAFGIQVDEMEMNPKIDNSRFAMPPSPPPPPAK